MEGLGFDGFEFFILKRVTEETKVFSLLSILLLSISSFLLSFLSFDPFVWKYCIASIFCISMANHYPSQSLPVPDPPSVLHQQGKHNAISESSEAQLWEIIDQARNYIQELEVRHLEDQSKLHAAIKELKQSAGREENLLQRVSELEQQKSIRNILSAQKEQTRINLVLMRSLSDIVETTKHETNKNDTLRAQMLSALTETLTTPIKTTQNRTATTFTTPNTPISAANAASVNNNNNSNNNNNATSTTTATAISSPCTVSPKNQYTITVEVTREGLGCAFDNDWFVAGLKDKSTMKIAGVVIGDQLVSIANRTILEWPSRSAIISFLKQMNTDNKNVGQDSRTTTMRFSFKRQHAANETGFGGDASGGGSSGVGGDAMLLLQNDHAGSSILHVQNNHFASPSAPHSFVDEKLFISTSTGLWR